MTIIEEPTVTTDAVSPDDLHGGRRNLLRLAGAAAAGVAVATVSRTGSASAANGDPITIGSAANLGTNPTALLGSTFTVIAPSAGLYALSGANTSPSPTSVGVFGSTGGGAGVVGQNTSFTAPTVFDGTGVAGYGDAYGVEGYSQDGVGVRGESIDQTGVDAISANYIDLRCTGTGRMWLTEHVTAGPPTSGSYFAGEVIRDGFGNFFVCVTGTGSGPGSWRRIGGPATAGQFHAIDPFRAYDSRRSGYPVNGPLAISTSRVINVKDARNDAGGVTTANVIPVGATAVSYNITVIDPTSPRGFLAVAPGDAASTTVASVNWFGVGQTIGNASVVKLDASRQVKVFAGGQPGSAGFAIDVVGYYA
jgi:hypothetical protein